MTARAITWARSRSERDELLLAYLDFLPTAFRAYGLPLELYVDYHSLFFTAVPESLTQLGAALHFYGVSFRYAPTPQAKGKIERDHQYWQNRLPAYFASEAITELSVANAHIPALRHHRNRHEVHRELQMPALAAWELARREKRTVLRPAPRCPWWPYVWSQRTTVRVGEDGRVAVGAQPGAAGSRAGHARGALPTSQQPPQRAGCAAVSGREAGGAVHQPSRAPVKSAVLLTRKSAVLKTTRHKPTKGLTPLPALPIFTPGRF